MTAMVKKSFHSPEAAVETLKPAGGRPAFFRRAVYRLILCCIAAMMGFAPAAQKAAAGEECIPVKTAAAQTRDLELTVPGIGTLQAIREVTIRPEINGLLESVHFAEGSPVDKGELLFVLDDNKIKEELRAKKAALQESEANLENARLVFNRRQQLYKQDLGTQAARDEAEARYKALTAKVERLKAEIAGTRESLADTRIKAPFPGFIGERYVDPGEWVSAGTRLAPLVKVKRLKIAFTIPEKYAGRAETGQSIRAASAAAPDREFSGSVYFVSPRIREDTRSLLIKAYIDNPDKTLLPGGFASVKLILEVQKDRPVIPEEALIPTRSGYMVFVVSDGKALGRDVNTGLRKPGIVEITEGLEPGETVIRSGHISVSEGDTVCTQN
ncbi:MAG: efflux RND transporter periplasmic adaptor subunit [Desulfosalsimonadaceae bacterium]